MKLSWLLFGLLLAMCLTVALLFVVPEPEGATGTVHPQFSSMLVGGDGAARHQYVLPIGWAFAVLQLALAVTLLGLGLRRGGRVGAPKPFLIVGFVLLAGAMSALFATYRASQGDVDGPLVLSFPPATAWMLYGIWAAPLFFVALYARRFRDWVLTEKQEEAFHRLVQRGQGTSSQGTK